MNPEDFLTKEEFKTLLSHAKTDREKALLLLMGGCGLRVSEVAALQAPCIDYANGFIYIKNAKGGKDRTVVAPLPVLAALSAMNIETGYMFPGQYQGKPLSTWQIDNILSRIAEAAGLQETRTPEEGKQRARKRITPHLLRHSHASWMLDNGLPVSDLQAQLGHTSLATTGLYLQRRPNHRREAYRRANIDDILK
jgi:integrase/recombinase XerD